MKKLMFVMAMMAAAFSASAGVSFSYQGALKTVTGENLAASERNKTIEFRLYPTPTGTQDVLWGRQVAVYLDKDGLFNVELSDTAGSEINGLNKVEPLEQVLAKYLGTNQPLYIGLTVVGSTGEIRPRQKLVHVPSAAFAADVTEAKNGFTVNGIATFNGAINATTNMTVRGKLEVLGELTASHNSIVPHGVIVMWSGTLGDVPKGWAICDGDVHEGVRTPDLRDRFIVGAGNKYAPDTTGGEERVTLKLKEIPSHQHWLEFRMHPYRVNENSASDGFDDYGWGVRELGGTTGAWCPSESSGWWNWPGGYDKNDKSMRTLTHGQEGGESHENRPPYYALCFIMKL